MPAYRLKGPTRPTVPPPPSDTPILAVVRVEAFRDGSLLQTGSGFWIDRWHSALITARHVVEGANSVRIKAKTPDGVLTFHAASVAFPPAPLDMAVLCTSGAPYVPEPFALYLPGQEDAVRIIGFPRSDDLATSGVTVVDALARRDSPWLKLGAGGMKGMSGGPVVLRNTSHVVGVYVGPRAAGGHYAFAIDEELFGERMLAADALSQVTEVLPS